MEFYLEVYEKNIVMVIQQMPKFYYLDKFHQIFVRQKVLVHFLEQQETKLMSPICSPSPLTDIKMPNK